MSPRKLKPWESHWIAGFLLLIDGVWLLVLADNPVITSPTLGIIFSCVGGVLLSGFVIWIKALIRDAEDSHVNPKE